MSGGLFTVSRTYLTTSRRTSSRGSSDRHKGASVLAWSRSEIQSEFTDFQEYPETATDTVRSLKQRLPPYADH